MAGKKLLDRLAQSMRGSNGPDELGTAAITASFALLLINLFTGARWLSVIALVLALYSWWRMSSHNIVQRRQENQAFVKRLGPAAAFLRDPRATVAERKAYKHLSCPSCHQQVRVPRGKGKLRVTCPACHTKFDARS